MAYNRAPTQPRAEAKKLILEFTRCYRTSWVLHPSSLQRGCGFAEMVCYWSLHVVSRDMATTTLSTYVDSNVCRGYTECVFCTKTLQGWKKPGKVEHTRQASSVRARIGLVLGLMDRSRVGHRGVFRAIPEQ